MPEKMYWNFWTTCLVLVFFSLLPGCSDQDKEPFDSVKNKKQSESNPPKIIDHGPKGVVRRNHSQIRITFNKQMRVLGEKKDVSQYFSLTPKVDCDFKWISETTVVCYLNKELKKAHKYKVEFKKGIKSHSGERVDEPYSFQFSTRAVSLVLKHVVYEKEHPVAVLKTNDKIDLTKLKFSLVCDEEGLPVQVKDVKKEGSRFYTYQVKAMTQHSPESYEGCNYSVEGTLGAPGDLVTRDIDLRLDVENRSNEKDRKERTSDLKEIVSSIWCGHQRWYSRNISNEKVCSSSYGLGVRLKSDFSEHREVKVIPKVDNMKVERKWRRILIDGDFKPGKNYDFVFSSSSQYESDLVVPVQFVHNPPKADLDYDRIVLEKDGPHLVPLSARNIESFSVGYRNFTTAEDISSYILEDYRHNQSLKRKELLFRDIQRNKEETFPVNIDDYGRSSKGLFVLNVRSKDLWTKAEVAHKKLFESEVKKGKHYTPSYRPYEYEKQFTAQVTNIGMHLKKGYLNTYVWVFDIRTGKPMKKVTLYAYTRSGEKEKYSSGVDGLIKIKKKDFDLFIAKKESDISYLFTRHEEFSKGISPWDFNVPYDEIADSSNYIVESLPDRPIYRPGDKVNLKFFIRKWNLKKLQYVHNLSKGIKVYVEDPRGEKVVEKHIALTDFSTASLEFDLPDNAKTGDYQVHARAYKNQTHHGHNYLSREVEVKGFKVQEFTPSPFKMELSLNKKQFLRGDAIKAKASSNYFFGGPNFDATGRFLLEFKHQLYRPSDERFKNYRFHDANDYDYYRYFYDQPDGKTRRIRSVSFVTDERGQAEFTKDNLNFDEVAGTIFVSASIKGESGQKIAKTKSAQFLNTTRMLGGKFEDWSYKEGSKLAPKVVVLDEDEEPVKGVDLEYELFRVEYKTTRRLGTGNTYYYDSEITKVSEGKCKFKSNLEQQSCGIEASSNGRHIAVISGLDSNDKEVEVRLKTWVHGGESYASWKRYNHDRIDLLPDKFDYEVGDTAKILIKSPFQECKALVTVERYGVIKEEIIEIKGNTHVYELPLNTTNYAPGIYVSAVLLKGRTSTELNDGVDLGKPEFKLGYTRISVNDKELNLKVNASASPKRVKPGEKVNLKINVDDLKDKNSSFELAVAVVDEAVLEVVSPYRHRYRMFDTFYKIPKLAIRNYQSLVGLLGRQTFGKKGGTPGGGGGFSKKIRKDFLPVAHWEPHLITDNQGNAEVEFEVPDNLTTWKVMVVANDKTRKFGLGQTQFMVTKDLLIEPVLPRFLTAGDSIDAKMVIHNKTGKKSKVNASIVAKDFSPEKSESLVGIEANDKKLESYRLKAPNEGKYEMLLAAEGDVGNDALRRVMNVIPIQTSYVDGIFGSTTESKVNVPFHLPSDIKKGSQELDVRLSSTLLTGLRDSFEYVLSYPYGCWEQKMTKAVYLAFYEKLRPFVGKINHGYPQSTERIQKLLDQSFKYIGPNGGMKYYPGEYNEESPYLSVFTAFSFYHLETAGYEVPSEVKETLADYLKSLISRGDQWPSHYKLFTKKSSKAMIVDILDRWGEGGLEGHITSLVSNIDDIPLFGVSSVLNVMGRRQKYQKKSEAIMENLIANMDVSASKAQFTVNKKRFSPIFLDTEMRSQCAMLSTMLEHVPNNRHVSKLQNYIYESREQGRWYNTQENFYCLHAMYEYSRLYEKTKPDFDVTTHYKSKLVNNASLDLDHKSEEFSVDINETEPGKNSKLSIDKSGKGRLYYFGWLKYAKSELPSERVNQGFKIKKTMYKFNEKQKSWKKLGQTMELDTGDIVKIRLKVEAGGNRTHVGVNDPLAACFTPVNKELATTSTVSEAFQTPIDDSWLYQKPSEFTWNSTFRYADMRKTAVQFYAPEMVRGEAGIEYEVRVTASGKFTMNAPSVEEMYYPDVRGTGLGRKITVHDK